MRGTVIGERCFESPDCEELPSDIITLLLYRLGSELTGIVSRRAHTSANETSVQLTFEEDAVGGVLADEEGDESFAVPEIGGGRAAFGAGGADIVVGVGVGDRLTADRGGGGSALPVVAKESVIDGLYQ